MAQPQIDPTIKAITTQAANVSGQQDPQIDAMMQSMMIQDADLMRILKGDIHDQLMLLEKMIANFNIQMQPLVDYFTGMKETQVIVRINQLSSQANEMSKQLTAVEAQLKRYRRYVPYLLLFTPTTVLSHITEKQAIKLFNKVDIMVTYDELDCEDDDASIEDHNFFQAIRIAYFLHVLRNVEGHTFKGLIEERRVVTNMINDQTNKSRKKLFGVF
jgi:hypothetical protein